MAFTAILLLGLVMSCAQVTLLRESLAAASGNELTVALGLTLWLLGSALGAGIGNLLPTRWARPALVVVGALSAVAPFVALYLARDAFQLFHVPPGELLSLTQQLAAGALALGPVCLLIGMTFTLACRLPGMAPRQVYLAEAVGWLVGGLLATWALVALPPFAIFLGLAAPTAVAVGLLSIDLPPSLPGRGSNIENHPATDMRSPFPGGKRVGGIGLAVALLLAVFLAGILHLPGKLEARTLSLRFPVQAVIGSAYTRVGHAAILERDGQRALYLNGQYAMALPEPQTAKAMAHLALLQVAQPRRVLLIGGLGGLLPEVLRYPLNEVTLAEEDPGVTRLVLAHADDTTRAGVHDPRVHIRYGDGRRTLMAGQWDAVLVNLPAPSTLLLNRFYTEEFFRAVRARLRPGGVLIFSLPGSTIQTGGEDVARNGAVFCALIPSFSQIMVAAQEQIFFLASDQPLCADPAEMGQRLMQAGLQTPELDQYFFYSLLDQDKAKFLVEQYTALLEANSDLQPVACRQELLLWGKADAGKLATALRALAALPVWVMGLLILGAALAGAGVPVVPWRRGAVGRWRGLFAVAAAGFAGMAFNVLILLLAQVTLGALYSLLGALMAAGMAGIALGAWLAERVKARLFMPLLLGLALALLLPSLVGPASSWPFVAGALLLALVSALAGMMVGAAFPLAVAAGLSPAAVYAADLLGAAGAGLLVGAILLPAHGLQTACLLLAGLLAIAFVASVTLARADSTP